MRTKAGLFLGAVVLLAAGAAGGFFAARSRWFQPRPELIGEQLPEPYHETFNPAERELNADLYVQTAAEYHALCLQTYRCAYECLLRRLADPPKGDLPFAVILDLDETVFDNTRYQAWCYRNGQTFGDDTWAAWEKESNADEVTLIPGALEFIHKVDRLKPAVKVLFVSNRRDKAGTLAVLSRRGLDGNRDAEKRLYLRTNGRDKDGRRKEIEKAYRVLLLVGDNLGDLSSVFAPETKDKTDFDQQTAAIQSRINKVIEHRDRFGYDWIILPNPIYGDWTPLLGDDPSRHLRQTRFTPGAARPEE